MLQRLQSHVPPIPAFDQIAPRATVRRYVLETAGIVTKVALAFITVASLALAYGRAMLAISLAVGKLECPIFRSITTCEKMEDNDLVGEGVATLIISTLCCTLFISLAVICCQEFHENFKEWEVVELRDLEAATLKKEAAILKKTDGVATT
jgi:hypothetical protein